MSTKKRITVAGVLTLLAITPSAHSLEQQIETLMTAPLKLIPIGPTPPPLPWPPIPPPWPQPPPPCRPWPRCIAAASAAPAADGGAIALAATL